jgi:hypothetical protein
MLHLNPKKVEPEPGAMSGNLNIVDAYDQPDNRLAALEFDLHRVSPPGGFVYRLFVWHKLIAGCKELKD